MNPFEIPIDIYLDFDKKHNFGWQNGAYDFGVRIKWLYKPIKRLRTDLDKCYKNHELIKYYFNLWTNLSDIETEVAEKEKELNEFINDNTTYYINSFHP